MLRLPAALIVAGAILMALNIYEFSKISRFLKPFSGLGKGKIRLLFRAHRGLIAFFLAGYLIVLHSILTGSNIIGEMFVGFIFFFGAVFVWIGIVQQNSMLKLAKDSLLKVEQSNISLEEQKKKLVDINVRLNQEIENRGLIARNLQNSQTKLKTILDTVRSGILIIDKQSKTIIDANPAALDLIQSTRENVIGSVCHKFVCLAEKGRCPASDLESSIDSSERELLDINGNRIPILKTVGEVKINGASVLIESFNDITQLKRTEDELRAAKESAESASQAKSDFLANMSHELRTPLNHIIGFTDLVVDENFGELNPTQKEYLQDVLTSSRHLLALINDILDLSKVEAGKLELQTGWVQLKELVENSLMMVKEKALKNQIKLETDLVALPEEIDGDGRKLKQVMYNLLSNAVKFTPANGSIHIMGTLLPVHNGSVKTDDGRMIQIPPAGDENAATPRTFARISVKDSGIGLSSKDLGVIFNSFAQVENSRSRHFPGTGLGLSLTQKFVALHGGAIWAESPGLNKGSSFHFVVPLSSPNQL